MVGIQASLLLLSTFLRCYKLLEIEREIFAIQVMAYFPEPA